MVAAPKTIPSMLLTNVFDSVVRSSFTEQRFPITNNHCDVNHSDGNFVIDF